MSHAQHQSTTSVLRGQLQEIAGRLTKAEDVIAELQHAVRDLQNTTQAQIVPIVSLAPKPFVVLREIPILVEGQSSDDNDEGIEYVCRFVEASVGTTGDTLEEAIRNMKDRLVSKFNVLDRMPSEKLGDGPRRQLAVLRSVMARAE